MATQSPMNGSRELMICQQALERHGCWYFTIALRHALGSVEGLEVGSVGGLVASERDGSVTRVILVVYFLLNRNEKM